ncbi:MAG: DUF1801 domain-containing protein [Armatimonadetes bacterium]|nr:DUF1801 domain-containing protein [Armatimonadota bacterium]
MNTEDQIRAYLESLTAPKQLEMERLHARFQEASPGCRLWFTDGRDAQGKVVANPNIGYGQCTIRYADGSTKEFYRIGLSANTGGISVYVLGLDDKGFLAKTFADRIGKAAVTGYCIKFKRLADIDTDVLLEAVKVGFGADGHDEGRSRSGAAV